VRQFGNKLPHAPLLHSPTKLIKQYPFLPPGFQFLLFLIAKRKTDPSPFTNHGTIVAFYLPLRPVLISSIRLTKPGNIPHFCRLHSFLRSYHKRRHQRGAVEKRMAHSKIYRNNSLQFPVGLDQSTEITSILC
jgi:hypothetical protein